MLRPREQFNGLPGHIVGGFARPARGAWHVGGRSGTMNGVHASETALLDALNRLGGRRDAPATTRDLIAAAPRDLPLVAVCSDGPAVTAFNVEAFIARSVEREPEALTALEQLVATGVLAALSDPGAGDGGSMCWATADPKGVAQQAVQWALDHPEHRLHAEGFRIARLALG